MKSTVPSTGSADIKNIVAGNNAEQSLIKLAMLMKKDIHGVFGSSPPLIANSESVQEKKMGNAPLIDTGELRDNLGYKINDGEVVK